jgi:hypothetical protein
MNLPRELAAVSLLSFQAKIACGVGDSATRGINEICF